METKNVGDDYLSGYDHKMWNLVQHVLFKWHTLVIYKYRQWNCGTKERGLLQFFVPNDCVHRYEIVEFLKYELEKEEREDVTIKEDFFPGVDVEVNVHTFSGLQGYTERDVVEKMAKEFLTQLKTSLMKRKDKEES